jgi:hypothetical protein
MAETPEHVRREKLTESLIKALLRHVGKCGVCGSVPTCSECGQSRWDLKRSCAMGSAIAARLRALAPQAPKKTPEGRHG